MSAVVQLPTWAVYVAGIGTPIASFAGVLVAQWATQWAARKGAVELETRSRREEIMRNLRWAAELAVSGEETKAELGVAQLKALSASNLSDPEIQTFVDAALDAVVAPVADVLEQDPDTELEPAVDDPTSDDDAPAGLPPVHSESSDAQEGRSDG